MGLSFLGSSFMSELGGKGFCMAALVMLGQEVTDLCLWVFGDMRVCVGGGEHGERGSRDREKQGNLSEACPNRAASKRTPVTVFLDSSIHSFFSFSKHLLGLMCKELATQCRIKKAFQWPSRS